MVAYVERRGWTSIPRPVADLARLDTAQVRGVAIHYTGSTTPLGPTATLALSARRLEDERRFHTAPEPAGRGWTDIAYQAAIDVEGRVFDARGIDYRSAANGNAINNRLYGAVTWLLGVGDVPTRAMVEAFLWWRQAHWLRRYPHATAIVGHRDLYATACPGDPVYDLIQSGQLAGRPAARPAVSQEDDMAMDPQERAALIRDIGREVAEQLTGIRARNPVVVDDGTGAARLPDGRSIDALPTVVGELQTEQRRQGEVLEGILSLLESIERILALLTEGRRG